MSSSPPPPTAPSAYAMDEWNFNENDKEDYTHYAVIPSEERNLTQGFSFPEECCLLT